MKYKTFRNIVVGVGIILAFFASLFIAKSGGDKESENTPLYAAPARAAEQGGKTQGPQEIEPAASARRFVRETLGQKASKEKTKDALSGAVKVNLYAKEGRWQRAKIDLDRDDRWDEKYALENGKIEVQVSPNDDEQYRKESATLVKSAHASADAQTTMRAVDRDVLMYVGVPLKGNKAKDVRSGKPYKINLYADHGHQISRAKVDLDRDDKWDEKWTFSDVTTRKVSPEDNETYTKRFILKDNAWEER